MIKFLKVFVESLNDWLMVVCGEWIWYAYVLFNQRLKLLDDDDSTPLNEKQKTLRKISEAKQALKVYQNEVKERERELSELQNEGL